MPLGFLFNPRFFLHYMTLLFGSVATLESHLKFRGKLQLNYLNFVCRCDIVRGDIDRSVWRCKSSLKHQAQIAELRRTKSQIGLWDVKDKLNIVKSSSDHN